MSKVQVEILSCGTKCRTVNHLGVEPNYWDFDKYPPVFELDPRRDAEENSARDRKIDDEWQQAEDARITYEIESGFAKFMAIPGDIHTATIINNKAVIK